VIVLVEVRLFELHGEFGEMLRNHDDLNPGDFAALDREQKRGPNLCARRLVAGGLMLLCRSAPVIDHGFTV